MLLNDESRCVVLNSVRQTDHVKTASQVDAGKFMSGT